MFNLRAKLIRIIGDPNNQRPDNWSSTVTEWVRSNGGMITDKGKPIYSEETMVKSQRLNALAFGRGQLKCDGTRAETGFRLSAKRARRFKSAGASVQSTTGSRVVRISGSNAGYTVFRGSVKGTGYPLHSPVSSSLPLPCVTVCHRISAGVYSQRIQ